MTQTKTPPEGSLVDGVLLIPFLCFDQLWASGRREEEVCKPGGTSPCLGQHAERTSEESAKSFMGRDHSDLC